MFTQSKAFSCKTCNTVQSELGKYRHGQTWTMKYKILQIFDINGKIIYSHVVRGGGQFVSCILTLAQFEDTSWIYKPLPYHFYSFYIMWGPCKSDFRVRRSPTLGASCVSLYTDFLPSSSRRPVCFCGLVSSYCCLNCSQRAANLCPEEPQESVSTGTQVGGGPLTYLSVRWQVRPIVLLRWHGCSAKTQARQASRTSAAARRRQRRVGEREEAAPLLLLEVTRGTLQGKVEALVFGLPARGV